MMVSDMILHKFDLSRSIKSDLLPLWRCYTYNNFEFTENYSKLVEDVFNDLYINKLVIDDSINKHKSELLELTKFMVTHDALVTAVSMDMMKDTDIVLHKLNEFIDKRSNKIK
jgi:uncharacterized membrane-anchored protein